MHDKHQVKSDLNTYLNFFVLNIEALLSQVVGKIQKFVPDTSAERRTATVMAVMTPVWRHFGGRRIKATSRLKEGKSLLNYLKSFLVWFRVLISAYLLLFTMVSFGRLTRPILVIRRVWPDNELRRLTEILVYSFQHIQFASIRILICLKWLHLY